MLFLWSIQGIFLLCKFLVTYHVTVNNNAMTINVFYLKLFNLCGMKKEEFEMQYFILNQNHQRVNTIPSCMHLGSYELIYINRDKKSFSSRNSLAVLTYLSLLVIYLDVRVVVHHINEYCFLYGGSFVLSFQAVLRGFAAYSFI